MNVTKEVLKRSSAASLGQSAERLEVTGSYGDNVLHTGAASLNPNSDCEFR